MPAADKKRKTRGRKLTSMQLALNNELGKLRKKTQHERRLRRKAEHLARRSKKGKPLPKLSAMSLSHHIRKDITPFVTALAMLLVKAVA